ncbi:hypothetical protein D9M71_365490 [compost metagenome]
MYGEQYALVFRINDLLGNESAQGFLAHDGAIDDLTCQHGGFFLQDGGGAILSDQFDLDVVIGGDQGGLLAAVEVAVAHVGNVGLGVGSPGAHFVRVLAGVVLDRQRGAAVRVAFAQNRVYGAALDLVVTGLGVLVSVAGRGLWVVRQIEALRLQFLDGGLELRYRGADVRQLDDVGFWRNGQGAEFCEVVRYRFVSTQAFREAGENASCQRDVAGFYGDVSRCREGFDDWQQRVGGEGRGFVSEGVDDLRTGWHYRINSLFAERAQNLEGAG